MRILFNHVGYAPEDEKILLIEAPADTTWRELALVSLPGNEVAWRGAAEFAGGVDGWSVGPWWRVDVSAVRAAGRYALRWATTGASGQGEGFEIGPNLLGHPLVSELLFYFKSQRSAGIYERADRSEARG